MSRNKNFFFVIIRRALFDAFENIFETRIFLGYISYDLGRMELKMSELGFKRRTQQRQNFCSGLKWRLVRLGGELPIHLTTINKLNLGFFDSISVEKKPFGFLDHKLIPLIHIFLGLMNHFFCTNHEIELYFKSYFLVPPSTNFILPCR